MALPRELGRRRTLLVLDGLDDQQSAGDVAVLLAAGPRLSVLATRRSGLGLASEHVLELRPFCLGADGADPRGVTFVQRLLSTMGGVSEKELDPKALQAMVVTTDGRAQQLEQIALDLLSTRSEHIPA